MMKKDKESNGKWTISNSQTSIVVGDDEKFENIIRGILGQYSQLVAVLANLDVDYILNEANIIEIGEDCHIIEIKPDMINNMPKDDKYVFYTTTVLVYHILKPFEDYLKEYMHIEYDCYEKIKKIIPQYKATRKE